MMVGIRTSTGGRETGKEKGGRERELRLRWRDKEREWEYMKRSNGGSEVKVLERAEQ